MNGTVMRGSDWAPLRGMDQRRLSEARLQAHYAVQWLARAARAYVPPQRDDEHTNLGWDVALGGFTTHPCVAELENYRSHARIACWRGKHTRPILFSRRPPGRAGRPVVERAARRTRARCARSQRAFTVRDARARRLPRRGLWPGRLH